MKCPMGYDDHKVTWRCYVVFAADWILGVIPERWPFWVSRPFIKLIAYVEVEREGQNERPA
jgi:hypothetical protein